MTRPWRYLFYHGMWIGLDWLFPPVCAGCGSPGHRFCPGCQDQATPLSEPLCSVCGVPLNRQGICMACRDHPPAFHHLRSWRVFQGPVQKVLHHLKYRRDLGLGEALAHPLADFVLDLGWQIDLVVPVPLGQKRHQERGYNQADLIAWPLSLLLGAAYEPGMLYRARETQSQVTLSIDKRRQNVEGAFRAQGRVKKERALIVDDVATTGSTLSACALALREAGVNQVFALTVARAVLRRGAKVV